MDNQEILKDRLEKLGEEHRELDAMIDKMRGEQVVDQVSVQRLKKRKLLIKDQILKVKSQLLPDITA